MGKELNEWIPIIFKPLALETPYVGSSSENINQILGLEYYFRLPQDL